MRVREEGTNQRNDFVQHVLWGLAVDCSVVILYASVCGQWYGLRFGKLTADFKFRVSSRWDIRPIMQLAVRRSRGGPEATESVGLSD